MADLTMQFRNHQWKVVTSGGMAPAELTYFRFVQRVPWYQAVLINSVTGVETPVEVTTVPGQWNTDWVRRITVV